MEGEKAFMHVGFFEAWLTKPGVLAKDFLCSLPGLGTSLYGALEQSHVALLLGLLNILVVVIFRTIELRRSSQQPTQHVRALSSENRTLRRRLALYEQPPAKKSARSSSIFRRFIPVTPEGWLLLFTAITVTSFVGMAVVVALLFGAIKFN